MKKHPAIEVYEQVAQSILDNKDDASLMPMGTGDIVGRARLESALRRQGIEMPENIIEFFKWWEEIGGPKVAKKWRLKLNRSIAVKEQQSQWPAFGQDWR